MKKYKLDYEINGIDLQLTSVAYDKNSAIDMFEKQLKHYHPGLCMEYLFSHVDLSSIEEVKNG